MKIFFSSLSIAAMAAMTSAEEAPSFYNPNETQGSFDFVMKPYPIPAVTTTYTDFFFNLPDDLPDIFHIVMGEVINSQPLHLHHFVLTGCTEKVPESIEGLHADFDMDLNQVPDCIIPLGGWAPGGNVFGNVDMETGVLMGKALGIQAVQLNVHYTDGVYEDPETQTLKMATDGIRVHYTPDFRTYSSTSKPLINIGVGPRELFVPPGEERFFVTKTCKVNTNCKDIDPEMLQGLFNFIGVEEDQVAAIPDGLSCPMVKPFCNMGGQLGSYVQQLCPESCGYCNKIDGEVNPLNPESYRITGVNYHAHLLGREMYTTLLREEIPEPSVAIQKAAPVEMMTKDMKSSEFWIYDFQETIPFDYEDIVATDGSNNILRGTEIKAGDKIQATCVYDSSYREEPTKFGLSTYDEMCITGLTVSFETPKSLLGSNGNVTENALSQLDLRAEIELMSFSCGADEETDIYTGVLAQGEDARDIWKEHPLSAVEGCTFPSNDFQAFVFQTRNCPVPEGGEHNVCKGLTGSSLLPTEIAGHSCDGGTHATRDSNDGLTETECLEGGGQWVAYTCADADSWLQYEAEVSGLTTDTIEYLMESWWQPKCCSDESDEDMESADSSSEDSDESGASAFVSSASTFVAKGSMGLALISGIAAMIL